jgi:hypothetical protein
MPYLHLTGDGVPTIVVAKSTFFYDSLVRGPAYLLHVKHLTHAQFTSLGVLAAWMTDSERRTRCAQSTRKSRAPRLGCSIPT